MVRNDSIPTVGSHGSARNKAYGYIHNKITRRELAPGMPISELAIARELGVSRSPVREAVGQLVAEGLLEQIPNRGTVVVQATRQDILDLFELREALEVCAVRKAARQPARPADLDRLRSIIGETDALRDELVRSGRAALNLDEMQQSFATDIAFHSLLVRMAANARLLKVVNETRLLLRIFAIPLRGHNAEELEITSRMHRQVIDAVAARDPDQAVRMLSEHIQLSMKQRLEEFDHWEREQSLENLPTMFPLPQ